MSIMTLDPVERMLDAAENGITLIKNRDILHYTYMPDTILHRDSEQEQVTQSKIQSRVEKSKFPIKLIYANSKEETTLYGLLVSFGRQLGLNEKELPSTGLAISEVFKRLLKIIDSNQLNAVFVIDEIDYLAHLISKTGKDVLYQLTRANERLTQGSLTLVGISNDLTFKER